MGDRVFTVNYETRSRCNVKIRTIFLTFRNTGGEILFRWLLLSLLPLSLFAQQADPIDAELAQYVHYDSEGHNLVGQISLGQEGINRSTWIYVKAALDEYKKSKPIFIIVHLDTPGGEVLAAEQISKGLIDIDKNYGIPCVAFVDNWAISAGALVAYSCRFIAAAKDAAMGAAEPILMGHGGETQEASEKIKSAIRADYANRAAYYGRNPDIAEAMVDKGIVLVLRDGQIVRLESDAQIRTEGPDPDVVINKEGKLLTLNARQMVEYGVADFMVEPTAIPPITLAERELGEWPADRSPLFAYPFFSSIPDATIQAAESDWKMKFFAFLTSPVVQSLLFLGMMLGFYVELHTPGFGVPGVVGLTCLFLIILSSFAMQAFNWFELILVIVGLSLVGVEVFVLPGFGIAGIVGIILTLVGLFGMMLPGIHDLHFSWDGGISWAWDAFLGRLAWLGGALVVGVILMFFLTRYILPKFGYLSRLVLRGNEQDRTKGFVAGPDLAAMPPVGSTGVARSPLRPAGKVEIQSAIYDAVSEGSYITMGSKIVVARYEGGHMIVQEIAQ
jgi:membrane-bound serine protease (ClpP class)